MHPKCKEDIIRKTTFVATVVEINVIPPTECQTVKKELTGGLKYLDDSENVLEGRGPEINGAESCPVSILHGRGRVSILRHHPLPRGRPHRV